MDAKEIVRIHEHTLRDLEAQLSAWHQERHSIEDPYTDTMIQRLTARIPAAEDNVRESNLHLEAMLRDGMRFLGAHRRSMS